jgi:hypothetical protein
MYFYVSLLALPVGQRQLIGLEGRPEKIRTSNKQLRFEYIALWVDGTLAHPVDFHRGRFPRGGPARRKLQSTMPH